jgi:hypothetical protein
MGRFRKASTSVPSSLQIRDTSLLEMPSMPKARTRSSTLRVEMPFMSLNPIAGPCCPNPEVRVRLALEQRPRLVPGAAPRLQARSH